MKKTNKIILIAILVAQGLVLHTIESMIPIPILVPGAKLGLTNLVTVIALYIFTIKDIIFVVVLRLFLTMLLGGSMSSLLYSASGALFSLFGMYLMKNYYKEKVSIAGVSIAGAILHNFGQISIASAVVHNLYLTLYLPLLTVVGILTGYIIGTVSNTIIIYLKKSIPHFS